MQAAQGAAHVIALRTQGLQGLLQGRLIHREHGEQPFFMDIFALSQYCKNTI